MEEESGTSHLFQSSGQGFTKISSPHLKFRRYQPYFRFGCGAISFATIETTAYLAEEKYKTIQVDISHDFRYKCSEP